ncbi:DNA-binding protein [Myroides pelagicus]|uniref:DNA-binding protein n=1 Tax=Myroides pelagicus TaxID=270914 RepID=UPI001878F591|nr:DNA-binding protein [Myroides pelagicus]
MKDLTNSSIERKNILNNNQAIEEIYINLGFYGLMFENKYRFTKSQVAQYFDVDTRTIDRILENNKEELIYSGYEVYNGVKLKQFKDHILSFLAKEDGNDIDVVTIKQIYGNEIDSLNKTSILGTFTYKAFLNIGMLLTDSENAQRLRSIILDIVIDFLNKKLGGKTKFINQREEDFISSAIREYNYRQVFTNYLDYYITDNKFKYAQLTDKIYKSLFKENANEYRQILNLKSKDSVRSTLYSEVLDLIASYENGFSDYLKRESVSS